MFGTLGVRNKILPSRLFFSFFTVTTMMKLKLVFLKHFHLKSFFVYFILLLPYVGRVVALRPREEVCLHDLLGVVGRDLPDRRVGLVTSAGQLQMEVPARAVHLQHLDGGRVRVVHLDHRVVAGVERQLDPHQRLDTIRIWGSRPFDIVSETSRARVNIQCILHDTRFTTKKHNVKGCITSWRNNLKTESFLP